jgi:hypothetical protein
MNGQLPAIHEFVFVCITQASCLHFRFLASVRCPISSFVKRSSYTQCYGRLRHCLTHYKCPWHASTHISRQVTANHCQGAVGRGFGCCVLRFPRGQFCRSHLLASKLPLATWPHMPPVAFFRFQSLRRRPTREGRRPDQWAWVSQCATRGFVCWRWRVQRNPCRT